MVRFCVLKNAVNQVNRLLWAFKAIRKRYFFFFFSDFLILFYHPFTTEPEEKNYNTICHNKWGKLSGALEGL